MDAHEVFNVVAQERTGNMEQREFRRTALRACIVNFRTRPEDVELLVQASADLSAELA